ncbi:MAG: cobalt-precorrin-5B (C(1))-methyltransferase CbiD [Deltaproteobacteria bacterium]|nr:cobalt-precorrin-5B (C(1))-methyltransferase CbiD [Deltaproteobacteria bacterium]
MLREGFTTGTAAAAAAKAALELLLTGTAPAAVQITLPPFVLQSDTIIPVKNKRLSIPIAACSLEKKRIGLNCATAVVIKDGGDDPDSTHGMRLEMTVALAPFNADDLANSPELDLGQGVKLKTGQGIGIVTLPGLPVRPGEPAVNPEPRKQIALAAREAASAAGYHGPIHLLLRAPEGSMRAERTLNARLGILGGISILGTHGIVLPYSHEAWQTAICQGFDIAAALDLDRVALSTGRRSEQALQRLYPAWPEQAFILAADFARFSISEAARRGFREIVWGCYPGKLLKLAQGLENTHANSAPADLGLIRQILGQLIEPLPVPPAKTDFLANLTDMPTVQGIFDRLEAESLPGTYELGTVNPSSGNLGTRLIERLAAKLADLALANLRTWAKIGQTGEQNAAPAITLCLFRPDGSLLYKSGPK